MRKIWDIVVELKDGCWSAWLRDTPQVVYRKKNWADAVAALIEFHDSPGLKRDRSISVETPTQKGHSEFHIQNVNGRAYPVKTSVN